MKRFTATEKWGDPWFRKLKPEHKAFWEYICDRCDNAGVWDVDFELASFCVGTELNESEIKEAFGDRIKDIGGQKWWITKFISFQYGELSEDCKPHKNVIDLLKKHQIYHLIQRVSKGYAKGMHTLQDMDKDKEKDKGGVKGRANSCEEVEAFCDSEGIPKSDAQWFWHKCQGNGWQNGGKAIKDWKSTLRSWKAGKFLPSQKQGAFRPATQQQTEIAKLRDDFKYADGQEKERIRNQIEALESRI